MNFKIGDMKSKSILNGIFITGLVYFVLVILNFSSELLLIPGTSGDSVVVQLNYISYIIRNISTPIVGLILFKLSCEILYKIVKACEIIIQNHNSKND